MSCQSSPLARWGEVDRSFFDVGGFGEERGRKRETDC